MLLYEGKAKKIYSCEDPQVVRIEYKDSATAFNGEKKETIEGKGVLNNEITSLLFMLLKENGVESHFIEKISDREQLVRKVSIIPLEVVVRNAAAGSFSKRTGMEEGAALKKPLVEFYYKSDELGDPLLTEDHIEELGLAAREEVSLLKGKALEIAAVLEKIFAAVNIRLIDFKLEFGKDENGKILLADEISPDTCRLWDADTSDKFDKDVFRRDLGSLTEAYGKLLARLGGNVHV